MYSRGYLPPEVQYKAAYLFFLKNGIVFHTQHYNFTPGNTGVVGMELFEASFSGIKLFQRNQRNVGILKRSKFRINSVHYYNVTSHLQLLKFLPMPTVRCKIVKRKYKTHKKN